MCDSVTLYEKLGLVKSDHTLTSTGSDVGKDLLCTVEAIGIELSIVEGSPPDELFLYDASVYGLCRREAIETPLWDSDHVILARDDDGHIVGYGAKQRLGNFISISPLLADNDGIARALLQCLWKQLPVGAPFAASVPTRNPMAANLWKEVGLTIKLHDNLTYMHSGDMRERCDGKIYNTFWGVKTIGSIELQC